MIYPQIPLAQSIIQICLAKGVKHIVISPGSRNAPLTIGFANNPFFKCYSIVDERCAAFFAMGIAQQLNTTVAVVCTSGSALLNYYPAFAEAFYSQIPLIVISADRPENKIDIGDGQTIRQKDVFSNHSLYNANLSENASALNDLLINEAINTSLRDKGPVHINAPFEEPLYETVESPSVDPIIHLLTSTTNSLTIKDLKSITSIWNSCERKLVLIGGNNPNELDDATIEFLANDPSVVVMTEVTSNVDHPNFIYNIDAIITPFDTSEFKKLQPQLLITVGGMIVSKRVKSFLRSYKPEQHWHIDPLRAYDTFESDVKHFEFAANSFFSQIIPFTSEVRSTYSDFVQEIAKYRAAKHREFLNKVPFSDFKAIGSVLEKVPKNSLLQISNSAAIRYAQLFKVDESISVFCNRGTSGIDGATSTAIGAAVIANKQTFLLTGDISFLYDSNALWNNYIPSNFKIIVINNGGGGIFRILPGHQENEVFNTFFETAHCLTAEHLAKMYRFTYESASDEKSLERSMQKLLSDDSQPFLLEIFTPTNINDQVLKEYFKALA